MTAINIGSRSLDGELATTITVNWKRQTLTTLDLSSMNKIKRLRVTGNGKLTRQLQWLDNSPSS